MRVLKGKVVTGVGNGESQSRTIIEVACEVKLRDEHRLRDGDVVEVEVAG
jgi:hypothetical protein